MKSRLPVWRRLGWRLAACFLLLTSAGILLSGWLQYRAQDRWLRQSLGEGLLNVARTGALALEPALLVEVQVTRSPDSEAWRWLRERLLAIQEANQLETPISALADYEPERRQARILVRGRGAESTGELYEVVPAVFDAFERAFREGAASKTDVYQNAHGTWITAFAPVADAEGEAIAMLAVDQRVDVYLGELAAVRRRVLLHSLAGALLALAAGALVARRISRPVVQLSALARSVVAGDLTGQVRVRSRDEIGLLGNVFHLMVERLHVSHRSIVDVLVRALEARREEPGALRRLALAAREIGERLDLSPAQREALELGALLHDIGETSLPDAILSQPGPLAPEERRALERHPAAGVELVEGVPLLTPALDVVGAHHERWDGGGYPRGLRGEAIPLVARIFAVADALDAMTRERPFAKVRSVEEALAVVRAEAGRQFDPRVAELALAIPAPRWAEVLDRTPLP
jgi:HD-GYP domain-containing protein (c-di-GMP phosphodiesterase class II)